MPSPQDPKETGQIPDTPIYPELVDRPRPPAAPAQPQPPQQIIVQQSGPFLRFFTWVGWAGLLICIPIIVGLTAAFYDYFDTSQGIQEKHHSLSQYARDKIAVIKVTGVIMESDEGFVKRQINRVKKDKNVKAVVVRIDSPGGTVTGSDYIYHHLVQLQEEKEIPLVVSMGGFATSGGYYVAMAVGDRTQSIFAEPTTTTGSIGVIIPHYDISGLMNRFDIKDESIATHPRKRMLSMTKPLAPEDRKILTEYINQSFERFKEIVKAGRPQFQQDELALNELATGEVFTANQALASGLVDKIGFVEAAIERAIELAQLDKDKVRVVTYKKPVTLLGALGGAQASWSGLDLQSFLDPSAPRAYYLTTSLPTLLTTRRAP